MAYFIDVRDPKMWSLVNGKATLLDNPFWEGNLNDEGSSKLGIYDMSMEYVENFFMNLECIGDELLEAGFDTDMIDGNVMRADMRADKDLDDYSVDELRKMSMETKVALVIGRALLNYLEALRNGLVIG